MPAERVDYLRRGRVSSGTILRNVIREFSAAPESIFCFFEGQDSTYYDVRIRNEFNEWKLSYLSCSGKDTLRAVYVSITRNQYLQDAMTMFFFDRDYDFGVDDLDLGTCYVTDGYSVENFYTSRDAFERIVKFSFFGDQVYDEDDQRCVARILCCFERLQRQFHKALLLFNAWAFVQRHQEQFGRLNLSAIDNRRLFTLDLNSVQATYSLEELNRQFPERRAIVESEIIEAAKWLAERDARLAFRGKQEAQFLLTLCNVLTQLASGPKNPFHRKLTCRLRL
jgi:hypothetical protein